MIAKTGFCSHNGGCFPTLSLIYSGLGDAVAEELHLPFDRISLERVFRGLYHFSRAYERGEADGPVNYFAAPENQDLGVVKRSRRKSPSKAPPQPDYRT
jgi:hypothetical protein